MIGIVAAVDTGPDLTSLICVIYQPRPKDPNIEADPPRLSNRGVSFQAAS